MYIGNNRHNKKTTRDLNNAKGIDLSLHTTKQSIRAPVLYAYLLVPTPSLVSSLLVILNACVFHSQWKHSKYYAVCWISIVLFTSLFLFLLSFIFDCVCACVCVCFWCIFITSKYIWNCLLSYVQNTQSYTKYKCTNGWALTLKV